MVSATSWSALDRSKALNCNFTRRVWLSADCIWMNVLSQLSPHFNMPTHCYSHLHVSLSSARLGYEDSLYFAESGEIVHYTVPRVMKDPSEAKCRQCVSYKLD